MLRFSLALALSLVGGCYLVHEREPAVDAGAMRDVGHDAAPIDAAPSDAHVGTCTHLVAGPTVLLEGPGGVTPRLVALGGGDVGIVYVDPGSGDPTSVYYERLDARLTRLTGPVLAATDSWTWAEPVRVGEGIALAFGSTAGAPSILAPFDRDGHTPGARLAIALPHPEAVRTTADGLFWLAPGERDGGNELVLAHLRADGSLVHEPRHIALGRYGSGRGLAARPDGTGHVVAYPSEGPSGVRRARVSAIDSVGTLSGEQTLSTDGADAAVPVFVDRQLRVVYRTDDGLRIAEVDSVTLVPTTERSIARLEGALVVDTVARHFVIGSFQAPTLTVIDGDDASTPPIVITAPSALTAGSISWVALPDAIVISASLASGSRSTPWVVRIECAD